MVNFINDAVNFLKPYTPYIMGGLVGSVVHRMRNEMSILAFLKSAFIGMFVSVCTGIVAKDYMNVTNENILFMLCGFSGVFSKNILDEIEPIIKVISGFIKNKFKTKNEIN